MISQSMYISSITLSRAQMRKKFGPIKEPSQIRKLERDPEKLFGAMKFCDGFCFTCLTHRRPSPWKCVLVTLCEIEGICRDVVGM